MKNATIQFLKLIRTSAACCAALFVCVSVALAEPVTVTGPNGFQITGDVINYDGDYLRLATGVGEVTLNFDGVTCDGADCPDLSSFVPVVRFSGASRLADLLLPALIEGYAQQKRHQSERILVDADHYTFEISDDGTPLVQFAFRSTTTDEGFADLLAYEADIAMSVREVTPAEIALAQGIGLGLLETTNQARIVALDGMIPIASVVQPVRDISLEQLSQVYAGEIQRWSDLGGPNIPISLHLLDAQQGFSQGFVEQVLSVEGREISVEIQRYANPDELARNVSRDAGALGVVPFGMIGDAVPLGLRGKCGLVSTAQRDTVMTGDYPLGQPLFLYLPERRIAPEAARFLDWLQTPDAQLIIRRAGFVDQGHLAIPIAQQGDRFASAIASAGEQVSLAELQRMVRLLGPAERIATTFRFEVGSTRLSAQSRSNVTQLARAIQEGEYDNAELILVGFSDGRGPAVANRDLSSARADAVRRAILDQLQGQMPTGSSLTIDAFGEALPMGCDDTEWGRQMNRRVELWLRP